MDVAAVEPSRRGTLHPGAQRFAAGVVAEHDFVELGALRWEVNHQFQRVEAFERSEFPGNLFFREFARRIEWSAIAVAQAREMHRAFAPIKLLDLAVKVGESEFAAEGGVLFGGFVIAGNHPAFLAEWAQNFAAALQRAAEGGEVAGRDVDVRGLRHDPFQPARVAMNVTENEDAHRVRL